MVDRARFEKELVETVTESAGPLRISGTDTQAAFRIGEHGEPVAMHSYRGIVEHSPEDMVVTVRGGTTIPELQKELITRSQCLYLDYPLGGLGLGTVGGAIAMSIPHLDEARSGTWRDWVLGMRLLLSNGMIVKCGSKAVKNVAGYDVQKLIVGSRGSLAIILEATLRTAPLRSEEPCPAARRRGGGHVTCIQRTLPLDFAQAAQGAEGALEWACAKTATLWLSAEPARRYPGDWVIRSGCGEKNIQITDPTQIRLMKRAKQIFDPQNKLNPGEWGFM